MKHSVWIVCLGYLEADYPAPHLRLPGHVLHLRSPLGLPRDILLLVPTGTARQSELILRPLTKAV